MHDNGMPSIEEQRDEARQWAAWFREAGYHVQFMYVTNERHGVTEPFDREWQIYTRGGIDNAWTRIGTIDIDGTGASWHGDPELWRKVIEPHVEMIDEDAYKILREAQL